MGTTGVTAVRDALEGVTLLGVDTAPVIYLIEANPRYDPTVRAVFRQIDQGALVGITSVITLGEVLVQPYARQDRPLQER